MQLTIMGRYGPYPDVGGACSGYLLQEEDHPWLLECGNGVLSRLQKYLDPWHLQNIIVSHLHADHMADLLIMRYAMDIAQNRGVTDKSLDVYLPDEPEEERARIAFKQAYRLHSLNSDVNLNLGPFKLSFLPVKHPLPSVAVKIESKGKTMVYSGDTEFMPELIDFVHGADLFLCEANFQQEEIDASKGNHLSAGQAAQIAAEAGVKRLILTHLPAFKDLSISLQEAEKYYPGAELAVEETTIEI